MMELLSNHCLRLNPKIVQVYDELRDKKYMAKIMTAETLLLKRLRERGLIQ